MHKPYPRNTGSSVTDLQRVQMANKLLETAKEMQLQGLKRVLGDAIKDPLIPKGAREHAERAYGLACMLEEDLEWRQIECREWMQLKGLKPENGDAVPKAGVDAQGVHVPVPRYILTEPMNLHRMLDFEIAQVGMIAGQLVYEDMVAETAAKKPLGGVFRDGRQPIEVMQEESQD